MFVKLCRSQCRLKVFENRVPRRISRPTRDAVTWEWRRLYNGELYALYSSPNIIGVIKPRRKLGGTCSTMGESRGAYKALVGKPEGRRPLGKPRDIWEDNIKMDLRELG